MNAMKGIDELLQTFEEDSNEVYSYEECSSEEYTDDDSNSTYEYNAWIRLSDLSQNEEALDAITNVVKIDNHRLITCIFSRGGIKNEIKVYDVSTQKWTNFIECSGINCVYPSIIWHNKSNKVWILSMREEHVSGDYTNPSQLFQISIDGTVERIDCNVYIGYWPHLLFINDTLHVIGGWFCPFHYIYDETTRKFRQIDEFKQLHYLGHSLIYVKRKNILLMFGGKFKEHVTDNISQYSIADKKWKSLMVKLPIPMYSFGSVITFDEKYIIIFGGIGVDYDEYLDNHCCKIYIYDVDEMVFSVSTENANDFIPNPCHAVLMNNKHKNELLTYGFVRREITINKTLVDLIVLFLNMDWIHVMDRYLYRHSKISVQDCSRHYST